ncbi:MAG: hypothetical protein J5636_08320 [Clostridiales bacterium]|nr:hypothetical protein [Clostridiales bacterium]
MNDIDVTSEKVVFENRDAKKRGFLMNFCIATPVFLMFTISGILEKSDNGFNQPVGIWIVAIAIPVIIGLILGIRRAFITKDVRIEITDEEVDVTVGSAHGTYPIADFTRYLKCTSSGSKARMKRELCFRDPEDEEEGELFINLPDISESLFRDIIDAICVKRNIASGKTGEYVPFEGDTYKGKTFFESEGSSTKMALLLCVGGGIFCMAVLALMTYLKVFKPALGIFMCIMVGLYMIVGGIVGLVYVGRHNRKLDESQLLHLSFHDAFLKINEDTHNYSEIDTIFMTDPSLPEISDDTRDLRLTLKSGGKPVRYIVGYRPDTGKPEKTGYEDNSDDPQTEEKTEESLAEGCSCEYAALFARIRKECEAKGVGFTVFK